MRTRDFAKALTSGESEMAQNAEITKEDTAQIVKEADQVEREKDEISKRRKAAGVDPDAPLWGLALSGGGIRSATFCLGLIKSLARNGLLKRFDYVSTVSGGGYAGAALGQIFRSAGSAQQVETELSRDDRLVWWWLRNNGRYLFPAGTRDTIFAVSTLIRGMLAVYFDLFMVGLLAACFLVAPHLLAMFFLDERVYEWVSWAPSAWWLVAAIFPPVLLLTYTWAYWFSAPQSRLRVFPAAFVLAIPAAIFAWLMWPSQAALAGAANPMCLVIRNETPILEAVTSHMACLSIAARGALFLLGASIPLAVIAAIIAGIEGDVGVARNRLTRALSHCLTFTIFVVLAAVADAVSWYLASAFRTTAVTTAPIFLTLLLVGRALLKWLKDSQVAGGSVNLVKVANAAGWLMAFLFFLVCAVFVQLVVFYGMGFTDRPPSVFEPEIWAKQSLSRLVWLALPCALYIFLTGSNLRSLNKSSLHNFYRARLTRSYAGLGNKQRFMKGPLDQADAATIPAVRRVSEVVPGDDAPMSDYAPHEAGGPIHLINVCVNQTIDDRSGEFNRDRLGRNLTVSNLGTDIGASRKALGLKYPPGQEPTLGQWVAISGAAAAPGMGSNTSKGLAALLTLCGVRLGYWLEIASARGKAMELPASTRPLAKYSYLLKELTATFPKSDSPVWYVSDGGHFENMGVYALLKREAKLIVAADCGADPDYTFGDLNRLVRIARIDFNAKITFLKLKKAEDMATPPVEVPAHLRGFGTLEEVASPDSSSYLVLAKIRYQSDEEGYLIVLKPALIHTLPIDLLTYKSANPTFPQQTTADQFFDEAQWESYFRLGEVLGRTLTEDSVAKLLPNIGEQFVDQRGLDVQEGDGGGKKRGEAPGRVKFAGEVLKSSIGVGAVAGLLATLWQVMDDAKNQAAAERQRRVEALHKAIEKSIDDDGGLRLGEGGVLFLRTALDKKQVEKGDVDYSVAQTLLARLSARCEKDKSQETTCKDVSEIQGLVFGTQTERGEPKYWSGSARQPDKAARIAATKAAPKAEPQVKPGAEPVKPAPSVAPKSELERAVESAMAACKRPEPKIRVYPNVYTKEDADLFQERIKEKALAALLASLDVKSTENVVASARRNGTRPPYVWSQPTLIYHTPQEQACAERLAEIISVTRKVDAAARPLPPHLRGQPGTIELWIPPSNGSGAG